MEKVEKLRELEAHGMWIKEKIWDGAEEKEALEREFEEVRKQVLELRAELRTKGVN